MRNSNLMVSATAAVGAMFGISAASAADFPATYTKAPPPILAAVYEWGGFYVGANGGWSGDQKCWNLNSDLRGPVANGDIGCSRGSGGVAGGQIGYRWQASAFVFGLEAQGDWSNLKGSSASLRNPLVTNQSQIKGLGLFTGQMGYAWNNVLFYLKGGAAVAADQYNGLGIATGVVFDQVTEKRWGGTAGAGIEFAFAPNWSVGVEYDHLFMGNANVIFVSTGMGVNNPAAAGVADRTVNIRQDVDMVTARINYRFGGPLVTKY
jgi:outer membrane immunogenic protein